MVTRRTAIGAGLAFASVACAAGFSPYGSIARRRQDAPSIDALLIDETIEMPLRMAEFIRTSGRTAPVIAIRLDAAGHAGLRRVLDKSHAIAGVSSGATLFCLERIAWDHGFRLTERHHWQAGGPGDEAFQQGVAAFLCGARPAAANPSLVARAYRPSRADGMVHAWIMQKSNPQLRYRRREEV